MTYFRVFPQPVRLGRSMLIRRQAGELFRGFGGSFQALQFLAGLEAHGFTWGDVDFFAGARVAADAGLAGLDAEDAEAAQFNALPAAEGILQGFEDGFDGLLRLGTADVWRRGVHDGIHDVQLNHTTLRFIRWQMLLGTPQVVKT